MATTNIVFEQGKFDGNGCVSLCFVCAVREAVKEETESHSIELTSIPEDLYIECAKCGHYISNRVHI